MAELSGKVRYNWNREEQSGGEEHTREKQTCRSQSHLAEQCWLWVMRPSIGFRSCYC